MRIVFSLLLFLFSQNALTAEFECISEIAVVVTTLPGFDQFTIKGNLAADGTINHGSIELKKPSRTGYF